MILYAYDSKDFLTQRSGWNLVSKIHPAKKNVKSPGGSTGLKSFQMFRVLRAKEMQMLAMIAGFGIGFVCVIGCGAAFCLGRCKWTDVLCRFSLN